MDPSDISISVNRWINPATVVPKLIMIRYANPIAAGELEFLTFSATLTMITATAVMVKSKD
ncbi:hypothetical protein BM221_000616 [Beauveria bassiana]|uniref:Uncharacterized protein n=1 Tax=Beauveria bassiana TaxID=176275 RepID=A0A2N6P105_BEABA|nr:hypothetical protein BM221_000616 [Beauveria bassiana]